MSESSDVDVCSLDASTRSFAASDATADWGYSTPKGASCLPSTALDGMSPPKVVLFGCQPKTRGIESPPRRVVNAQRVDLDGCLVSTPEKSTLKPSFWPRTMSGDVDCLEERVAFSPKSCAASPAARVALWPRTMSGDDFDAMFDVQGVGIPDQFLLRPLDISSPVRDGHNQAHAMERVCTSVPPPPPSGTPPCLQQFPTPPPPTTGVKSEPEMQVLSLVAALPPEPELGSADLPTVGSRGHRLGNCKPCAFLHTKGCTNGKACAFCHLCARGEKKRRQRECQQQQLKQVHQAQVQQQQMPQGLPSRISIVGFPATPTTFLFAQDFTRVLTLAD